MEKGFIEYLQKFFWDEGYPAFGDVLLQGCKNVVVFDILRDFKRVFNKPFFVNLFRTPFIMHLLICPFIDLLRKLKDGLCSFSH